MSRNIDQKTLETEIAAHLQNIKQLPLPRIWQLQSIWCHVMFIAKQDGTNVYIANSSQDGCVSCSLDVFCTAQSADHMQRKWTSYIHW